MTITMKSLANSPSTTTPSTAAATMRLDARAARIDAMIAHTLADAVQGRAARFLAQTEAFLASSL
jgi:hypothetical protein